MSPYEYAPVDLQPATSRPSHFRKLVQKLWNQETEADRVKAKLEMRERLFETYGRQRTRADRFRHNKSAARRSARKSAGRTSAMKFSHGNPASGSDPTFSAEPVKTNEVPESRSLPSIGLGVVERVRFDTEAHKDEAE